MNFDITDVANLFGMLGVIFFALYMIPVIYVLVKNLSDEEDYKSVKPIQYLIIMSNLMLMTACILVLTKRLAELL